jgi:hypothetical protein
MHSDNDLAPVAYLRIHRVTLASKSASVPSSVPIPPLLDPDFAVICNPSNPIQDSPNLVDSTQYATASPPPHQTDVWLQRTQSKQAGPWVAIANVQRQGSENVSIEEEVQECFSELLRASYLLKLYQICLFRTASRSSQGTLARPIRVCSYQRVFVFHGSISLRECGLFHLLWHESSFPCMRRCRSIPPNTCQVRLHSVRYSIKQTNSSCARFKLLGSCEYWALLSSDRGASLFL